MQRLPMLLAVSALLTTVSLPWEAEAMVPAIAAQIRAVVQTVKPVEPAACRGWGEHCPPGYVWNGRRCVPC